MATPPTFSAGAVLTAAQMNRAGLWKMIPTVSGTGFSVATNGTVTISAGTTTGGFINSCFTADFRNYKIIFSKGVSSTTSYFSFQLSVGGVANSTASSYIRATTLATTAAIAVSANTDSSFYVGAITTTNGLNGTMEFFQPQIAAQTGYTILSSHANGDTVTGGGRHNQATAYDGLKLFCNAGTFDLLVDIYGYTQ